MNVIKFMSMFGKQLRMGDLLSRKQQVKFSQHIDASLMFSHFLSQKRMENRLKSSEGINYAEFSYQVFQAYDWFYLYQNHNCTIQVLVKFFSPIFLTIDILKIQFNSIQFYLSF